MKKRYLLSLLPVALWVMMSLHSCSLIDPKVVVPCYGRVDSMSYFWSKTGEGSRADGITDAWVYMDDNPIGAFEMPCKFPIVASNGQHTITIYPGIKEDGFSSQRTKYPYYTSYTVTVNLKQDSFYTFKPTGITYVSYANFAWNEGFETGTSSIKNVPGSPNEDTTLFIETSNVFAGLNAGAIVLDSTATHVKYHYIGQSDTMTLPKDGNTQVYLEINYNCNADFNVGLMENQVNNSETQQAPSVVVYPTNGVWKKMYINLTNNIASAAGDEPFRVYFELYRPAKSTNTYLYLDNIRLVY
jgi:hypothetical protein